MMSMAPYWATMDLPMGLGVGVTAASEEDARSLIRLAYPEAEILEMRVVESIHELEQNHVVPNMSPNWLTRGIWFPRGFEQISG